MDMCGLRWIFVGICMCLLPVLTEGLSCYQCNVFVRGTPWPCNSDRGMRLQHNCTACLKSFTRAYLHNTFHDQLFSTYISRVCVRDRWQAKDAGCHNQVTDSGYMKRCYCYQDYCNHSTRTTTSSLAVIVGGLVLTFILKFQSRVRVV